MTLPDGWQLGPFTRSEGVLLKAQPELAFHCPVSQRSVAWAAKDVFNPGAIVRDGCVYLLVRAEDTVGRYSGTSRIGLAVSDDCLSFRLEPAPLLFPRRGRFDSLLVEPGPPALVTPDGVLLLYNGANHPKHGDASLPAFAYQPGQALFDSREPGSCIARSERPFLRAERASERIGQVRDVCFAQGLVLYRGCWQLYYGMADSKIGCATAPAPR